MALEKEGEKRKKNPNDYNTGVFVIGHPSKYSPPFLVSRTDTFVTVFSNVTSPRVLSNRWVLHYMYFLTMSVGFYLNLTFGLKPQVGGIKIVRHCLQTIHFLFEWLIATLINDPLRTLHH